MKLRRLIVSGFKSFADRTEFEFHDGITCVVGPNGCGKSNIVDAIKWVLGEQSAKSLRGSEMMDIIFNGSVGRKPCGHADVTLVFDDPDGVLTVSDKCRLEGEHDVSVTRRLYRGGHSEYLINNVACRLKDVREMFMDTGIGADAYSVIEQGRVEIFLNASTEDRRGIFDEAAGISRYKARKKEALRRLERVEQNLARVNDILGEVEKRLRSVKLAAGKARSYQTHSERLRELKSLHFLAEYHRLTQQRTGLTARLDEASDRLAAVDSRLQQLTGAYQGAQAEVAELDDRARQWQNQLASAAAQLESTRQRREMLAGRVQELTDQIIAASGRCEQLEAKMESVAAERAAHSQQLREMDAEVQATQQRHTAACEETASAGRAIAHLQDRLEDEKDGTMELLRRTAQLHSDVQASATKREHLSHQQDRLTGRAREIADALAQLVAVRSADEVKLGNVQQVLSDSQSRLEATRGEILQADQTERHLADELTRTREQRSALDSRIQTLEEMLTQLEGVDDATRAALDAGRTGRLAGVRGMLGDFIETDVERAAVVEAALGGADRCLVADQWAQLPDVVRELSERLSEAGFAELVCLDRLGPLVGEVHADVCDQAVAHVMDWIRFETWLSPILWRLLGNTLVVRTLADAAAAFETAPVGVRFVTLSGEVLEPDGRVRLGAAHRSMGVIRRRSELASLQEQLAVLDEDIQRQRAECEQSH
ncbi:MAG: chromosome segregation SMC family protein, partial [Planctomycetota bacterium]